MSAAPDLFALLRRHWSSRAELAVHRVGVLLDRAGLPGVSDWWADNTWPLVEWLADRQRAYVRGLMR